jgi:hypothetical protein
MRRCVLVLRRLVRLVMYIDNPTIMRCVSTEDALQDSFPFLLHCVGCHGFWR